MITAWCKFKGYQGGVARNCQSWWPMAPLQARKGGRWSGNPGFSSSVAEHYVFPPHSAGPMAGTRPALCSHVVKCQENTGSNGLLAGGEKDAQRARRTSAPVHKRSIPEQPHRFHGSLSKAQKQTDNRCVTHTLLLLKQTRLSGPEGTQ